MGGVLSTVLKSMQEKDCWTYNLLLIQGINGWTQMYFPLGLSKLHLHPWTTAVQFSIIISHSASHFWLIPLAKAFAFHLHCLNLASEVRFLAASVWLYDILNSSVHQRNSNWVGSLHQLTQSGKTSNSLWKPWCQRRLGKVDILAIRKYFYLAKTSAFKLESKEENIQSGFWGSECSNIILFSLYDSQKHIF